MILENATITDYIKMAEEKKVCFFGAGKALDNFLIRYKKYNVHKTIAYIIDNDKNKQNNEFIFEETSIPIIDVGKLKRMQEDIMIIISTAYAYDIYMQLNKIESLKNVVCMVTYFIVYETNRQIEQNREYPETFKKTIEPLIPRKIHYCWFGKHEMSDLNKRCLDSWYKTCPEFEIICWDENNYEYQKNSFMKEAYEKEKWAYVSDYARMDIIYNEGGIYLDTDVELIKDLEDLLYQKAFFSVDFSHLISSGLGFGAEKNNNYIKMLMDMYIDMHFVNKDGSYNEVPVPELQRKFFKKLGYKENGEYCVVDDITILPETIFAGYNNLVDRFNITDKTYALHHFEGTWTSDESKRQVRGMQKLFKMCTKYK
mgnify:FL=1